MDAMDGDSGRLLRIEQIADRLSVSRSMAWKIIDLGQLRSVRIGRAVRVRPKTSRTTSPILPASGELPADSPRERSGDGGLRVGRDPAAHTRRWGVRLPST